MGYPTKIIYTAALISSINNLSAQEKIKNTKPNIVVFLADDAGMDFGCYGNKNISTPNIDKIAKNGILFKNAFRNQVHLVPVCLAENLHILSELRICITD